MITHAKGEPLAELTKEGFCLVDFYSDTCVPCKMLAMVLARLESEMPFVNVVKVNLSECPDYGEEYKITGVPTMLFMNNGELKERVMGGKSQEELQEKIAKYMYE